MKNGIGNLDLPLSSPHYFNKYKNVMEEAGLYSTLYSDLEWEEAQFKQIMGYALDPKSPRNANQNERNQKD